MLTDKKIEKLVLIADMYYCQKKSQGDIAVFFNISRPMVSKYLDEAHKLGIVNIEIKNPLAASNALRGRLYNMFNIKECVTVEGALNDLRTTNKVACAAIQYIEQLKPSTLTVGFGSIIGEIVYEIENRHTFCLSLKNVAAMIGTSGVSNRNYHSNELVRVIAEKSSARPQYLYSPAFVESYQELLTLKALDGYMGVKNIWEKTDIAVVNIGNFPSVPDFATSARYGNHLIEKSAVGKLLCYYYNLQGEIIFSNDDCTMQIPLNILSTAKTIIGVAASNVSPKAMLGALNTGIFTTIIACDRLVQAAIKIR